MAAIVRQVGEERGWSAESVVEGIDKSEEVGVVEGVKA